MQDNPTQPLYDPSMALIRQLVTEYIIFPLGSKLVRQRFPEWVRSFIMYGPQGTGKTMVVRAVVHETQSLLFDLSPANIDGKYNDSKQTSEKLVAMVFMVAKEYQPAVIYIDEAERMWAAKKKKKKGKGAGKAGKRNPMAEPARLVPALTQWQKKFMTDDKRITILACTSEPQEGNKKKIKKFFDRAIYFPFPDYSTRRLMWKTFITELGGKLKPDFPLSTLAHVSAGYSAGSIRKTCESILTEFRKGKVSAKISNSITVLPVDGATTPDHARVHRTALPPVRDYGRQVRRLLGKLKTKLRPVCRNSRMTLLVTARSGRRWLRRLLVRTAARTRRRRKREARAKSDK